MSTIQKDTPVYNYSGKEIAYAYQPEDRRPFIRAAIGETVRVSDYHIRRAFTDRINNIEYILDGKGEVLIDGEWKKVSAGDMFILSENDYQEYRTDKDYPWHKLWIVYRADYIATFMNAYGISSGVFTIPDVKRYFERAHELAASGEATLDTCYEITKCVHSIIISAAEHKLGSESGIEYKLKQMLSAAVYKKVELDSIASELHLSKSTIIRIFKKAYGTTPYEFLIDRKIEAAKTLLSSSCMLVKEISEKLCFTDEHYFSSLFLKRVGERPTDYRARHRQ